MLLYWVSRHPRGRVGGAWTSEQVVASAESAGTGRRWVHPKFCDLGLLNAFPKRTPALH